MKGIGIIGDIVGVIYAVPTFGASLLLSPNARKLAKGILGVGDDNGNNQNLETWKIQNEQWKLMMESQRAELEQLRKEKNDKEGKVKNNNDEIARLNAIVNDPHRTQQEKDNARKRMVLLETDNKKLKRELDQLNKNIEDKSKIPSAPSKPWSFPKLSLVDKTLIAGGVVLLVYLLIPDRKK